MFLVNGFHQRENRGSEQPNKGDLWSNSGSRRLVSNGTTAIKPFTMAEHGAVLMARYNTNITPAKGRGGRRVSIFSDYSRALMQTAVRLI